MAKPEVSIWVTLNEQPATAALKRLTRGFSRGMADIKATIDLVAVPLRAMVGLVDSVGDHLLQAAKKAISFQKALAEIATISDAPRAQVQDLVISMAQVYGSDAEQQAKAFYEVLSAGITDTAQASEVLREANKLAIGGMTDTKTAIDGLTSVLNSYARTGLTAQQATDAMFIAIRDGKTRAEELAQSIGMVTPIASVAGVSFDQLSAAIATLTTKGLSTSQAAEYLRAALSNIIKPGEKAIGVARQLGIDFSAAALQSKGLAGFLHEVAITSGATQEQLGRLFRDVGGMTAVLALEGDGGEAFARTLGHMADKAGAAQMAFQTMSDTMDFSLRRLESMAGAASISIGGWVSGSGEARAGVDAITAALVQLRKELDSPEGKRAAEDFFARLRRGAADASDAISGAALMWRDINVLLDARGKEKKAFWEPILGEGGGPEGFFAKTKEQIVGGIYAIGDAILWGEDRMQAAAASVAGASETAHHRVLTTLADNLRKNRQLVTDEMKKLGQELSSFDPGAGMSLDRPWSEAADGGGGDGNVIPLSHMADKKQKKKTKRETEEERKRREQAELDTYRLSYSDEGFEQRLSGIKRGLAAEAEIDHLNALKAIERQGVELARARAEAGDQQARAVIQSQTAIADANNEGLRSLKAFGDDAFATLRGGADLLSSGFGKMRKVSVEGAQLLTQGLGAVGAAVGNAFASIGKAIGSGDFKDLSFGKFLGGLLVDAGQFAVGYGGLLTVLGAFSFLPGLTQFAAGLAAGPALLVAGTGAIIAGTALSGLGAPSEPAPASYGGGGGGGARSASVGGGGGGFGRLPSSSAPSPISVTYNVNLNSRGLVVGQPSELGRTLEGYLSASKRLRGDWSDLLGGSDR